MIISSLVILQLHVDGDIFYHPVGVHGDFFSKVRFQNYPCSCRQGPNQLQFNASGKQSEVGPVQDVPGDDAMGSAEPGAELREEDVGADGQQQSLLLDQAIAASI